MATLTRMLTLIDEFQRLTDELTKVDYFTDPMKWDEVSQRRFRALEALLDEEPTSVAEFADKFDALIPFTEEDTELTTLRILADDIRSLSREEA